MKDEKGKSLVTEEPHNELVSFLLRLAGSRPAIPVAATERVHAAVRAHWKRRIRKRSYSRWIFSMALPAAALFILYALSLHFLNSSIPSSVPIGFVENLNGNVFVIDDASNGTKSPLGTGDILMSGMKIETDGAARVLCHVLNHNTFRLDTNSRIRLSSEKLMTLERGAVYIDSANSQAHLSVRTPIGMINDVGTQFEVRFDRADVKVRVREGAISLKRNSTSTTARECSELSIDPNGKTVFRRISKYGPEWNWVSEVAPTFHIEGQHLIDFLNWVTRESGWSLRFEDSRIQEIANATVLHGSIRGMLPQESPDAVLPVCGLSYSLINGVFTVKLNKQT